MMSMDCADGNSYLNSREDRRRQVGSHWFPFLSALLKHVSTGTLVGAQRWPHLIDSARLPRQP